MRYSLGPLISAFLAICCLPALAAVESNRPSCVQADHSFNRFLIRFAEDKAFQRTRLVLPLVVRSGDVFSVDNTVELWPRAKLENFAEPLIYSREELERLNLVQSIVLYQPHRYAEVYQENAGEADDTRLLFHFRNLKGCWYLEEFDSRGY